MEGSTCGQSGKEAPTKQIQSHGPSGVAEDAVISVSEVKASAVIEEQDVPILAPEWRDDPNFRFERDKSNVLALRIGLRRCQQRVRTLQKEYDDEM